MINEQKEPNGAIIDKTRKYRYLLWRTWDDTKSYASFILLNPSKANKNKSDLTVDKCLAFAQKWELGGIEIVNLFAYRSPKKEILKTISDPIGPENDRYILESVKNASLVVAGWGNDGLYLNRDQEVMNLVKDHCILYCLLKNKSGCPTHPRDLSINLQLSKFE